MTTAVIKNPSLYPSAISITANLGCSVHLVHFPASSNKPTMATSSLALKRLVSPTLSAASCVFSARAYDPFYDVYGATKSSHTEPQVSSSKQIVDVAEMTRYVKHKNTDDALHLRLLMPGLAKEDAKLYIVKDELIAEGLKEKDFEDDKDDVMLRFRIQLPIHLVKADAITTKMKDGLLKVCVPMIDAQKMKPCF